MAKSQEDSYASYTSALVIVIVLTLGIAFSLRLIGCVPYSYFPYSRRGLAAVILVVVAWLLCLLNRGISITLWKGRDNFWKPKLSLDFIPPRYRPQWLIELSILLLSITALCLLLLTSGGTTGPFNVYLGLFPLVISVLSSSRPFIIITFVLTLGVYICTYFFATPLGPQQGHEVAYGIASVITFAVSLTFTAWLILSEIRDTQRLPEP